MLYFKLVRDRIPERLQRKGVQHSVMQITKDDPSYEEMLMRKLEEEIVEFRREGSVDELADVMAVIRAIRRLPKFADAEKIEIKKQVSHGGFTKGFILISAT